MAAAALLSPLAQFHLDSRDTSNVAATVTSASVASRRPQVFRFLDMPPEIRSKIYDLVLFARPGNQLYRRRRRRAVQPRVALFLVSRRVHEESAYVFYTEQVFRIFNVQDFRPLPTVRDLALTYRPLIKRIELILGPGWTSPPKDWVVTPALGLQNLSHVQTIQVFVELDPSHPSLRGFRVSEDFYTNFAGKLLSEILADMPQVKYVQIDTNPSVKVTGPLITRLVQEIAKANRLVRWGPGPKGRASENIFAELLSHVEPWLKPAFPERVEHGLPYLTIDESGHFKLTAPRPLAGYLADVHSEEEQVISQVKEAQVGEQLDSEVGYNYEIVAA